MLLDPEYGLPATKALDKDAGLLLAYEKTGYDTSSTKRLPDCLNLWSAKRIKEQGADAVKFLLYYDVDSAEELNQEKQAYIERIGSECVAESSFQYRCIESRSSRQCQLRGRIWRR